MPRNSLYFHLNDLNDNSASACSKEELKAELKSLRVKVDLLEARNIENVDLLTTKLSKHETKILKQEEEIAQLKAKIDTKLEADHLTGTFADDRDLLPSNGDIKMSTIYKKESSAGLSTRASVPSSCRELSFAGHSLDGLYLVKNQDTKKIETVLCTFGTVGKLKNYYLPYCI